jgi:hypothetical protein
MTSISNSAARYRGLSFLVLLTTAACGGRSADLGRYGTVDASPDPFETDSSTGTPKPATDAAADGSTDDGGIDVNTACLVDDNKFVFLEEPSLPVVIEGGTDWLIFVDFVIDGLPSYLDIMIGLDWDAQFSTNGLGKPLFPGVYTGVEIATFAETNAPGPNISGTFGGCNTVTGQFQVIDMKATPLYPDAGQGEPKVQSFTATFIQYCEGAPPVATGCIHVSQ